MGVSRNNITGQEHAQIALRIENNTTPYHGSEHVIRNVPQDIEALKQKNLSLKGTPHFSLSENGTIIQ